MVLVGNKCDLESSRQVSTLEGKELAKFFNCPFFETSAKERTNVDECFLALVKEIARETEPSKFHHFSRFEKKEKESKSKKYSLKNFKECRLL